MTAAVRAFPQAVTDATPPRAEAAIAIVEAAKTFRRGTVETRALERIGRASCRERVFSSV